MRFLNGQTLFDLYNASSADFRSQAPAYHGLQWTSASCEWEGIIKHEMALQWHWTFCALETKSHFALPERPKYIWASNLKMSFMLLLINHKDYNWLFPNLAVGGRLSIWTWDLILLDSWTIYSFLLNKLSSPFLLWSYCCFVERFIISEVFLQIPYLILVTTLKARRIHAIIPILHLRKLRDLPKGTPSPFCLFLNYAILCVLISYASTDLFWKNYIV